MWIADWPAGVPGAKNARKNGTGSKGAMPEKAYASKRKAPPSDAEGRGKRPQVGKDKQVELPPPPKGPPPPTAERVETLPLQIPPPSESSRGVSSCDLSPLSSRPRRG